MFTATRLENTVLSVQTLISDNCNGSGERELALNTRLTQIVELYHPAGKNSEGMQLYDTTSTNKRVFVEFIYELVKESRQRSGALEVAYS